MKSAGNLISAAAELAARMQHGIHDLERRFAGLLLDVHGDAAPVVRDADYVAGLDCNLNVGAVSGKRLVNGVVDNLVNIREYP